MQKTNLLGVNFSNITRDEVLALLPEALNKSSNKLIVTPNAEFVLAAQDDEEFFYILNHADLAVLDGSGPQFAARLLGQKIERYPGADLVQDLLRLADEQSLKVLIINWQNGLSSEHDLRLMLASKYPKVIAEVINTSRHAPKIDIDQVKAFAPKIILCSLGAPFQEKTLYHLKAKVPSLGISIGIGGALDFLTGKIRRAPKILRVLGLEWLWRLVKQPSRFKRIWNAVIVFTFKFIRWQFFLPYFYRPNVACWLYKETQNGYSVLMVERADQRGHWQLPQGGTDGEPIERAGRRELFEELGINQIETKKIFKNVFRYTFHQQKRAEVQRHLGYKGQKQSLYIAEFLGQDEHFAINFWDHTDWKWVPAERVVEETYTVRREGYQKFQEAFFKFIKDGA